MMANFTLCFNAIMPLLLLMLLGFFLKRIGFISDAGLAQLDKLGFKIFIPVMLFSNVYHSNFTTDFNLTAVVFMELAVLCIFVLSMLLVPLFTKGNRELSATVVHAICHGNLAVLGLPLIQNLFGAENMALYSILVACTSPMINPLMVFEHLYFEGSKMSPGKTFVGILTSPFLVGTLFGLAFNLLHIVLPTPVATAVANIKSIASPLCLIALGASFKVTKGAKDTGFALAATILKTILIPACVLGVAVAMGLRGIVLASLMVIFCCPCATATYSYCVGYCGDKTLAAHAIVYSTVLSMFTMFGWLMLFLTLGYF